MRFEFDPHKSASNQAKHGIDFEEAQALWQSRLVEVDAKDAADKRYLVIGTIRKQFWSAVITYRGMTIRSSVLENLPRMKSHFMAKLNVEPTNAGNLEARFEAGEEVLDYFDLSSARVVLPSENGAATPSIKQLKQAIQIARQIERLQSELSVLLNKGGTRDRLFQGR